MSRLGLGDLWRDFADDFVLGGPRVRHVFPALLVYLFVQQAVLGVILAAYYSPSATDAWASTAYLNDQVTLGWFVRGLHYHGTSAMVVVAGLYLVQLALHRAYRNPREYMWLAGLAVLGLLLAAGVTGNALPWDQQGYWGIQVELGIAEQAPGGGALREVTQGGSDLGNFTVLRLYVLHAFVLPGALAAVLAFIVFQLRRHGAAPPATMSDDEARRKGRPYFPSQAFLDVLAMTLVAGGLVALTVMTHGGELYAPADPTENFQARPEWYFLALYKLRMFFEGPLEPIATMLIPGAAAAFLVAAPFIDQRSAGGRIIALAGTGLVLSAVVALTGVGIMADRADEDLQEAMAVAHKRAEKARALAREGVVPQGGTAVWWNDPQYKIRALFKEHCQNCHMVEGIGGEEAPDLTDYASREWLSELIRSPAAPRFFGGTPHDEMEDYPEEEVSTEQLQAVVEFLVKLEGAEVDVTLAEVGAGLWEDELDCNNCHEIEAGKDGDGPNLLGHASQAWVERVIRDSSKPDLYGEAAEMPKFEGKLSDEEIADLAAFVVAQRAEPEADAG